VLTYNGSIYPEELLSIVPRGRPPPRTWESYRAICGHVPCAVAQGPALSIMLCSYGLGIFHCS